MRKWILYIFIAAVSLLSCGRWVLTRCIMILPKAPVVLRPGNPDRVRKEIDNDHVIIIRNNEKYDVTGKKLQ